MKLQETSYFYTIAAAIKTSFAWPALRYIEQKSLLVRVELWKTSQATPATRLLAEQAILNQCNASPFFSRWQRVSRPVGFAT
jgi:hypothetical protein